MKLPRNISKSPLVAYGAILFFVVLGVYLIARSSAAGPFITAEPENGTLSAGAVSVNDTAASGGKAIRFASSGAFVHPGILVNRAQLDFTKSKLALSPRPEPWGSAFTKLATTKNPWGYNGGIGYGDLTWTAHPVPRVICTQPPTGTGCPAQVEDGIAAYTHALLYYYNKDIDPAKADLHAQKSIQLMNAWSAVLIDVVWENPATGNTSPNGLLQNAWGGSIWPRAAEIIHYTYTPPAGKTAFDVTRFSNMLKTAYQPHLDGDGWIGGSLNWLQSMHEARMHIAIFTDDRPAFDAAVNAWKGQTKAAIYMSGDVNPYLGAGHPYPAPGSMYDRPTTTASQLKTFWYSPNSYVSGLQGETCREPNHSAMGFGAMINAAETARIQGVDLYSLEQTRIVTAMEKNTAWNLAAITGTNPPPGWVCPAAQDTTNGAQTVTFEMGYNHYALRNGVSMPNTKAWIERNRSSGFKTSGHMVDELLTHHQAP